MKLEIFFMAVLISTMINYSLAFKGKNVSIRYVDDYSDVKKNVRFFLYRRENKNKPQQLFINDTSTLKKVAFDVSLPTKFVTHGWNSSYRSDSCASVVKALLMRDNYNVIAVDYEPIAKRKYSKSASKVRSMGTYIGKMIAFVRDQGASLMDMSLIGHSMGAHVMGFAGKNLPDRRYGLVEHIVGLDPSGVGFDRLGTNDKLSRDDAENVQIIHTNMGQSGTTAFMGHSDFYPNGGGPNQPGCPNNDKGSCAHHRSHEYYVEALQNPKYWLAIMCGSYKDFNGGKCRKNRMAIFPRSSGKYVTKHAKYFLRTNSKSPFGLGRNGTQPAH